MTSVLFLAGAILLAVASIAAATRDGTPARWRCRACGCDFDSFEALDTHLCDWWMR